jgi:hypothetical protein
MFVFNPVDLKMWILFYNSGFKVPGFDVNPIDEMGRTPMEVCLMYSTLTIRFELEHIFYSN